MAAAAEGAAPVQTGGAAELEYDAFQTPAYAQHREEMLGFLDAEGDEGKCMAVAKAMMKAGRTRYLIDLDDLRRHNRDLADAILRAPLQRLAAWEDALKLWIAKHSLEELIPAEKRSDAVQKAPTYTLGFEGSFGRHRMTPRTLTASHITNLVAIEGIATKLSLTRPKMVRTTHYSEKTDNWVETRYVDATSIKGFGLGSSVYPQRDAEGNPLTSEFGLSDFRDHQTLTIQEMPEKCSPGQMPRSVNAVLEGDLVDRCKPGDRVLIVGTYRAIASASNGETHGNYRTVLIVNHLQPLSVSRTSRINENDVKHIVTIGKRKDAFDVLSRSIAPSIDGHENIKKAMLLLLLGGVEKNLKNGSHIRG